MSPTAPPRPILATFSRMTVSVVLAVMMPTAAWAQRAVPPPPTTQTSDVNAGEEPAGPEEIWPEAEQPKVLTAAGDVVSPAPGQAAAGRPVRISGVVTYLSGMPSFMFVQDITGGVCVSMPRARDLRPHLRIGAVVQVEGMTADGGQVPYVTGPNKEPPRVEVVVGNVPHPRPRTVTLGQLRTTALHGQLVEVEAVVRSVHTQALGPMGPTATVVTLAEGDARAEAVIFGRVGDAVATEAYVGAVVRARGVFNAAAPDGQEWPVMRLLSRSVRDLVVREKPVPARDLPVVAVNSLAAPPVTQPATATVTGGRTSSRARVCGTVTLSVPGRGVFLQDGSGGVWVEPPPADAAEKTAAGTMRAGDRVAAVGFPSRRGWSTVLADAIYEKEGQSPLPEAPLVTAERALAPPTNGRLVRIEGLVLSASRLSDQATLVIQSGSRVFLARMADPSVRLSPGARVGNWVRLTGVCVQTGGPEGLEGGDTTAAGAGERGSAPSFHLLLAGPQAIELINPPGWWTSGRVMAVVAALAAVALVSFAWVVALRRRVARQTALIRQHLATRTLYEERVRIARDLHDSLEQDLLGITLQLNATDKLLGQPDQARRSLQLAAAMVRRSQAETHRAVWDLRERRSGQGGLVPALREAVVGLAPTRTGADANGGTGPRVDVRVHGEQRELPQQVENHLLRVALEAVTNAVKHAGADQIMVDLYFAERHVELRVKDDGRGFDAQRLPPPSSGHFGLFGMRERAEKLGGDLVIRSRAGEGTEIGLTVPLSPDRVAAVAPAASDNVGATVPGGGEATVGASA